MMHSLHKCLLVLLFACLEINTLGNEIIHGKKAPNNKMLYMASLQNDAGIHICGGFLISEDLVVSAAHCYNRAPTSVVLGTHNLKKVHNDTMRYRVKPCKHPSYKKTNTGDDIMLLKLLEKARLNKRVKLIELPKSEMEIKDNTKCSVAGWGANETGGQSADVLQEVDVSVVDYKACGRIWNFPLPANVICAGGYKTDKGFCQGDSGGPLVCHGKAVGVVSFNYRNNCDYPNYPNIYTDISKYLSWISKVKTNGC
ncbi:trypsin-3-like [Tautogolabrus adspersus]